MIRAALPIDPLLPELARLLATGSSLVLEAPPGAGKTTRVPPALEAVVRGEIIVVQPRRLAARLAAMRVADERGEKVGDSVGYQVRFEDRSGPRTRIRFVTDGILMRRLQGDPSLTGVGAVVLDEFHERRLAGDVCLAQLRVLQRGVVADGGATRVPEGRGEGPAAPTALRPDLRLVVMSATLDAAPVAAFLACPSLRAEGRRFEVAIEHLTPTEAADERPLEIRVAAALRKLLPLTGHVLVFLPGAAEIRRAREATAELAAKSGLEVHVLHGDLPADEQDRAVRPGARPRLILSTNVAETSVTIDGVAAVIDSGLARVASHSPWSGLATLKVAKISRASATQRAGRAGRTQAGRCLRLYTKADHDSRPEHDTPELGRLDLAETVLALRQAGHDPARFPFFEAPPAAALDAADQLLGRLGALEPDARGRAGAVTPLGRRLAELPVHPRQARLMVEAERRGVAREGALLAALLGERDIRAEARGFGRAQGAKVSGNSDLLELADRFREAGARLEPDRLRRLGLDPGATMAVDRAFKQLARLVRGGVPAPATPERMDEALMLAVLTGYPDRVARRRRPRGAELVLCGGETASLDEASVVKDAELMIAVDADQRRGIVVRLASQIEPEWLFELPGGLIEAEELAWNADLGRVDRVTRLSYGSLVLEERRGPAPPSPEAAHLLGAALLAQSGTLLAAEPVQRWLARLAAVHTAGFEVPAGAQDFVQAAIARLASSRLGDSNITITNRVGSAGGAQVDEEALIGALTAELPAGAARLLSSHAPERVTLPGGRALRIHYQADKPPWIESRLQDFFGMAETPRICAGRTPLVIHLLAPSQRPVQVTTDLAGFWERHYPALRRQLMRQYPRHPWPEDPLHASPPPPQPPRRR